MPKPLEGQKGCCSLRFWGLDCPGMVPLQQSLPLSDAHKTHHQAVPGVREGNLPGRSPRITAGILPDPLQGKVVAEVWGTRATAETLLQLSIRLDIFALPPSLSALFLQLAVQASLQTCGALSVAPLPQGPARRGKMRLHGKTSLVVCFYGILYV